MASDGRVGRGCGGNVHSCIRGRDRWSRRQRQTPITARAKLLDGRARTNACTASRPARPPLYPMHEPRDDINCSLRVSAPGTDANTPRVMTIVAARSAFSATVSRGSGEVRGAGVSANATVYEFGNIARGARRDDPTVRWLWRIGPLGDRLQRCGIGRPSGRNAYSGATRSPIPVQCTLTTPACGTLVPERRVQSPKGIWRAVRIRKAKAGAEQSRQRRNGEAG